MLSQGSLTEDQLAFVRSLGVSLGSGHYDTQRRPDAKLTRQVHPGLLAVGKPKQRLLSAVQQQQLRTAAGLGDEAQVSGFRRAFINEETIMGTCYRRSQKRCNSVVAFTGQNPRQFAQVHSFHLVENGQQFRFLALVRPLLPVQGQFLVPGGDLTQGVAAHFNACFVQVHAPL